MARSSPELYLEQTGEKFENTPCAVTSFKTTSLACSTCKQRSILWICKAKTNKIWWFSSNYFEAAISRCLKSFRHFNLPRAEKITCCVLISRKACLLRHRRAQGHRAAFVWRKCCSVKVMSTVGRLWMYDTTYSTSGADSSQREVSKLCTILKTWHHVWTRVKHTRAKATNTPYHLDLQTIRTSTFCFVVLGSEWMRSTVTPPARYNATSLQRSDQLK